MDRLRSLLESGFTLSSRARLIILLGFVVALYVVAKNSDFVMLSDTRAIQEAVHNAGAFGVLLYFAAFSLGQLLHMPGLVFVAAASVAFGQIWGFVIGMSGACIAISMVFFIVRYIGGTPLAQPNHRWLKRLTSGINSNPFRTIVLVRLIFSTGPWLNYALAMSSVSYRCYISASFLGMLPQVLLTVYLTEWLIEAG